VYEASTDVEKTSRCRTKKCNFVGIPSSMYSNFLKLIRLNLILEKNWLLLRTLKRRPSIKMGVTLSFSCRLENCCDWRPLYTSVDDKYD